jgi:hypothetical protein
MVSLSLATSSIEAEIYQSEPSCAIPSIVHVFMPSHPQNILSNVPFIPPFDVCAVPI